MKQKSWLRLLTYPLAKLGKMFMKPMKKRFK